MVLSSFKVYLVNKNNVFKTIKVLGGHEIALIFTKKYLNLKMFDKVIEISEMKFGKPSLPNPDIYKFPP